MTRLQDSHHLAAGMLSFKNNYAINEESAGMPARDFTVEFWGRTPTMKDGLPPPTLYSEFFSYAARIQPRGAQCLPCTLTPGTQGSHREFPSRALSVPSMQTLDGA